MSTSDPIPPATIVPIGDSSLLVRFGATLTDQANRAAIALDAALAKEPIAGVVEVAPNLISVLLRYDPLVASQAVIAGEVRLRLFRLGLGQGTAPRWTIPIRFEGPDVADVAAALGLSAAEFISAHNARPLRVLATGFAPGFVYCGLHAAPLVLPRRVAVRPAVPAGSVLFAAGQTAITASEMPTGWHVIGHTSFANFDPSREPPTRMAAGDLVSFEVVE